jgi:pyruvate kinase
LIVRKTKIIATLGPSVSGPEAVVALHQAGADVFRLNCSHLPTSKLAETIEMVRNRCPEAGVLVDIQGPKMRYGGDEITLDTGASAVFDFSTLGLEVLHRNGGLRSLTSGQRLLLDDGRIETRIESVSDLGLVCRIVKGGRLIANKGVNLPDTSIQGELFSDKDREDMKVARGSGVDFVALSFVQTADDVRRARVILGDGPMIIAKIERPQALDVLDEILEVADGVMAARGDLGVEMPYVEVPAAQHRIARTAIVAGKVSVCATEMLESMTTKSRPTRAEVADVSTAVLDGFDAVMLSGETAIGHDPLGAVQAMARIVEEAEGNVSMPNLFADAHPEEAAVTAAAAALAKRVGAQWIISLTYTGFSARLLSACRPNCPIISITPTASVASQLKIVRGVVPLVKSREGDVDRAIASALHEARSRGLTKPGDRVVVCASRISPRSDADTLWLHQEPQ